MKLFEDANSLEIKSNTSLTCLFFDSLSNPYFNDKFKKSIFKLVWNKISKKEISNITFNYMCNNEWFFTWEKDNLEQILMKKELRNPY